MYADDAILTYSCNNMEDLTQHMQSDLSLISNWLQQQHLKINVSKSYFVLFKNNVENTTLTISGTPLKQETTFKYLGLHVNAQLNWNNHIDRVCKKISPFIYVLYKFNSTISKNILYQIYFAHIHSRLIYMNCIWSTAAAYKINNLRVLQNKAIKAIHRLPRLTPSSELYTDHLLPVETLGKYELIMLIHKIRPYI